MGIIRPTALDLILCRTYSRATLAFLNMRRAAEIRE